ncbi:MAG TPA: FAD-dependent oxidoreductase [Candidatus Avacidaminococcus intestinavium]|uniref:FAD-dependent oxidoreductase n=1 Tax=Candidatus Avacidaminococcus intestinavium TaxID=2840684 RepID=A0A9D1MQ84_9FIRM|nr:FAD-dependent oxidoreductase [Candidatus Avacidaminococcus intestinavium]
MAKYTFPVTREEFLQLNLPERLKLWAEDRELEEYIKEKAFVANPPSKRVPRGTPEQKVAIIGSGPAGLGCADELASLGFSVTVFERDDRAGGLLVYGVPNIKLPKMLLKEKLQAMQAKGVEFRLNTLVGKDILWQDLEREFAAIVVCTGSTKERELKVPGADLAGVVYAKEYLQSTTRSLLEQELAVGTYVDAKDKNVLIIGGGDTGADCSALALAQGAKTILQLELQECEMTRNVNQEGFCEITAGDVTLKYTTKLVALKGDPSGKLTQAEIVQVAWGFSESGLPISEEKPGTNQVLAIDLAIVAIGFTGPEPLIFESSGITKTPLGTAWNVSGSFATAKAGIFVAGDVRRGGGMVEWAFAEGRDAAAEVAVYLAKQ